MKQILIPQKDVSAHHSCFIRELKILFSSAIKIHISIWSLKQLIFDSASTSILFFNFTLFYTGGAGRFGPHDFFYRSALEHCIRWNFGVFKSKTSKKVSGPKNFYGLVQGPLKSKKQKKVLFLKSCFRNFKFNPRVKNGADRPQKILIGRITLDVLGDLIIAYVSFFVCLVP